MRSPEEAKVDEPSAADGVPLPPPPPGDPTIPRPPPGDPTIPPPPATPQAPITAWTPAPAAPAGRHSRRNWAIGCVVLLVVLVVGVASCSFVLFKSFGAAGAVLAASGGEIDRFNVQTFNGVTETTFWAARGVDESDGPRIACEIIGPTLAGSDLAGTRWYLVNRAGDVIASNETACD